MTRLSAVADVVIIPYVVGKCGLEPYNADAHTLDIQPKTEHNMNEMEVPMQNDAVERALAVVAASRAWREKAAMERANSPRKIAAATARPAYVLKSKQQLELRLQ